jgi:hypothetical protein
MGGKADRLECRGERPNPPPKRSEGIYSADTRRGEDPSSLTRAYLRTAKVFAWTESPLRYSVIM